MKGILAQFAMTARTIALHALRRSDRAKWQTYQFPDEWALRSKRIAEIIPPGSHVFEFGAGPVGLSPYLDPSCLLTSSDLVKRTAEMTIIDLNRRPLPSLEETKTQIAVFAGVLEYISDLFSIMPWIAEHFEVCIASYECAQPELGALGAIRESLRRTLTGWVNHLTETELKALFASVGFQLSQRMTWGDRDPGDLFVFTLSNTAAATKACGRSTASAESADRI